MSGSDVQRESGQLGCAADDVGGAAQHRAGRDGVEVVAPHPRPVGRRVPVRRGPSLRRDVDADAAQVVAVPGLDPVTAARQHCAPVEVQHQPPHAVDRGHPQGRQTGGCSARFRRVLPQPDHLGPGEQRVADDRVGRQRELDVAPAFDAQRPDDLQAGAPQHLVLFVGERLAGSHHNAVARVHAHRVDVLHDAHRDAVVRAVPHHLVLQLLPPHQALLQERLMYGAGGQAAACDSLQLIPGPGYPAPGTAQGIGGAYH